MSDAQVFAEKLEAFRKEAHGILSSHESVVKARVFNLRETRKKLSQLSVKQESLFEEALQCTEYGLNRAAILAAWIGFMDALEQKLASDNLVKVHTARPKWDKSLSIHELREKHGEYQVLEVAYQVGLLSKQVKRVLEGNLSTRNDCAHSSDYSPDVNEALGFISGILNRVQQINATAF